MANPVVLPSAIPTTVTNSPIINGFNPCVKFPKLIIEKIKKNVAITSLKKLNNGLLIAGRVAKIPTVLPSETFFDSLKCG